jgi:hypothetical protein
MPTLVPVAQQLCGPSRPVKYWLPVFLLVRSFRPDFFTTKRTKPFGAAKMADFYDFRIT